MLTITETFAVTKTETIYKQISKVLINNTIL